MATIRLDACKHRQGRVLLLGPLRGGVQPGHLEAAQCLSAQVAARGRAGQAANGALRRRGLLRDASWKACAWVWKRQVKVLPAFSKAAVGKSEPYGLTRRSREKKSRAAPACTRRVIGRCPGAVAPRLPFPQAIVPRAGAEAPCFETLSSDARTQRRQSEPPIPPSPKSRFALTYRLFMGYNQTHRFSRVA